MRWLAVFFVILTLAAFAPFGGGGQNACPASVDGAQLTPPSQLNCVLTDHAGNKYVYDGTQGYGLYLLFKNGNNFHYSKSFQLSQGLKPFVWLYNGYSSNTNYVSAPFWIDYDTNRQAASPDQGDLGNWAKIGSTTYPSLGSAPVTSGTTVEVLPMPTSLPVYFEASGTGYAITPANVRINCDPPAAFGFVSSPSPLPGQAVFALSDSASGFTMSGCEIAGAQGDGQQRAINMNRGFQNLTLIGTFFHDNDFGLQGPGNHGTVTLTNTRWDHNGGAGSGPTHNIYLGGDVNDLTHPTTVLIKGGYSVCADDGQGGFPVKLRGQFGTIQNFLAADVSFYRPNNDDCQSSGAIDLSCGGVYTIGGTAPGTGTVLEFGPKAVNKSGLVRMGAELTGTGTNCSPTPGGVPYPTNTLLVQNSWLILDAPGNPAAVYNGAFSSVTVKNSKIVCNGSQSCDAAHVLAAGPGAANVTDGGGNIFFANRAAAGLGPYPMLPSPP